jgi:hypothetical protein
VCLDANTPNFSTFDIDNAVSSIKVYGGVVAILYNDANYGGSGYIYDTNTSPVASNDTASSLKILNSNDPFVCVYANSHNDPGVYLDANIADFSTLGINDALSSIKVYGGAVAVLYNNANYGGSSYIYDTDTSPVTSNDTASSLKILNSNDPFVCVYADSYNDLGVCLNANTSDLSTLGINDAVSSIKVYGGAVAVLYNNANYSGDSYAYEENISPVISNDTASSLEFFDSRSPVTCVYKDSYNSFSQCRVLYQQKRIALGAEVSAASATYAFGDTGKSYGSVGVSQGGGASFGAKWGDGDQYGFSGSMLCCSISSLYNGFGCDHCL